MKFPASDCNGILDIDSIMPVDFLIQVREAIRLMEVLASPIVIDCLFLDCVGTPIDDLREYPIRACPECWKLFCINCKCLHLGMTCENYQFKEDKEEEEEDEDDDDDDEGEEEEEEKGSRIIATTRHKHLIETSDVIYEVTTLVDHQATKLFNQYAFVKKEVPNEYFEKLSMEVVHHAKCLPLALKVWGCLLHKRDITEWRSAMEEMKNNSKIVEKLRISYDRLEAI
ncbi:hypothetical protein H5410_030131 [Solanum commersonii]|uniref:Uncharacterized protein n=1 Tax=Solanum commersonii TaxID=4109 RepID=A0A9J5YER9_SOLCO|nr:hypothetical protein H5410_030131 [Solanum commersonii]